MEVKLKAKELVDKFIDKMFYLRDGYNTSEVFDTSKQCALIAVDEILEELKSTEFNYDIEDLPIKYWQEVKNEIKKL
jgi:hypothetical protein